jgi:hypothetical protein
LCRYPIFTVDWNKNSSMPAVVQDHLRELVRNGALSPLAFPNSVYIKATDRSKHLINLELLRPPHTWMLSTTYSPSIGEAILTPGDILAPRTSPAYDTGMRLHDWDSTPSILMGPRAPVVEVPEARHHVMLDQPLAFVAALRMLLDSWVCNESVERGSGIRPECRPRQRWH